MTEYKTGLMSSYEEAVEQGALRAWNAYRKAVGGKAVNGDPLPDWDTLKNDPAKRAVAQAWMAVSERLGGYWTDQYLCNQDKALRDGERERQE